MVLSVIGTLDRHIMAFGRLGWVNVRRALVGGNPPAGNPNSDLTLATVQALDSLASHLRGVGTSILYSRLLFSFAGSCRVGRLCTEVGSIEPHAMQHDRHLPGERHARFLLA